MNHDGINENADLLAVYRRLADWHFFSEHYIKPAVKAMFDEAEKSDCFYHPPFSA